MAKKKNKTDDSGTSAPAPGAAALSDLSNQEIADRLTAASERVYQPARGTGDLLKEAAARLGK